MTATYNPSLTTDKDIVRFYISDTEEDSPLLQDEEILGALNLTSGPLKAAIQCANTLALKFSRMATVLRDDLGASVEYGDRAKDFRMLVTQLRAQIGVSGAPTAGGLTHSSKRVAEQNTDRVQPAFRRNLHDAPGTDETTRDYHQEPPY